MFREMQKIPLADTAAGMVLARDVFRDGASTGFPVCGKSTVLTEALIDRLKNMEISSVYVTGCPLPLVGGRSLEDVLRDLEYRFSKVREDPLMAKLYDIYVAYYRRCMGDDSGRQPE